MLPWKTIWKSSSSGLFPKCDCPRGDNNRDGARHLCRFVWDSPEISHHSSISYPRTLKRHKCRAPSRSDSIWATALGLLARQQLAHHRLLFFQFVDRGVDLCPAEIIDGQALYNLKALAVATQREGANQILFDPVTSIRANTHAMPIPGGGWLGD